MPTLRVTPKTIEGALRSLGRSLEKEAIEGMRMAAARTVRHIVTRIIPSARPRPPVGVTGHYRAGWKMQDTNRGAIVYNAVPYAGIVEEGRRAGKWPPRKPIYLWIRRVLNLDEDEARKALFPIMRKIKTKGIKGRHILRNAIPAARRFAVEETQRAFVRVESKFGHAGA